MSAFHELRFVRKVYITATSVGLATGLVGYGIELWGQPVFPFIGGVLLSTLHIFLPRPEIVADDSLHPLVRVAALLCGISGFIAAGLLWLAAANRSLADIWDQFFRKRHVLVVGDGAFAHTVSDSLAAEAANVLHAFAQDGTQPAKHRAQLELLPETLEHRVGLMRCETVVVDTGTDSVSLALARRLLARLKSSTEIKTLAIRIADPVLSDQFFEVLGPVQGDLSVSVFDENQIVARRALAETPLYKRAAARGQDRVHAVILGFGDLGEKLLDQVFLTSVASGLDMPRVTVLDPEAAACERAFRARRPRVMSNLPIRFLQFDPERDPNEGEAGQAIRQIETDTPFTMIYVASPDHAHAMRRTMILHRLQRQFGLFQAPISYHCPSVSKAEDFLDRGPIALDAAGGFMPLSRLTDGLAHSVLDLSALDQTASRIHEAYRTRGTPSPVANVAWKHLPDTFKRSNRRTGDHAAAKLWSVGVRLEPGLHLSKADRAKLEALRKAADDDPQIVELARLEHERWRLDRFLDGWEQGSARDDARRIHTTLLSFEDLQDQMPGEVEKDITQVRELIAILLET